MAKKSHNAERKKVRAQRKKAIILVGAILLLAATGGGGWYFFSMRKDAKTPPATQLSQDEKRTTTLSSADQLAQSKGADKGAAVYDEAVKNSNDQREKSELLVSKATLYLNEKKYDIALSTALEADRLYSTAQASAFVAQLYELKNNTAQAAAYYQKASELVSADSPMAESDRSHYKAKVKELEAR
jgi:tetratricopeptide (TPR) repeat protein